jgi:hypothetical protein
MSHFDDFRVEFMLQIASYSMGMDSVDHPSQVEKYSCHAKHQGKDDKRVIIPFSTSATFLKSYMGQE